MTVQGAKEIVQYLLDRQGESTMTGDIDGVLKWLDLPCTLESIEVQTVARTDADLRIICATFIQSLQKKRLTHMVRRCLDATFKSQDTIWATYETRYIQDGTLLIEDPYLGFVTLRHHADRWKIDTMQFAVSSESLASATLRDFAQKSEDRPKSGTTGGPDQE